MNNSSNEEIAKLATMYITDGSVSTEITTVAAVIC